MVGTPPHLIGDVSGSTSWGTGIEQQVLGWVKFTLQMWITSMEQRWAAELLPPSRYVKHSLEGLLRGDSAARAAFYHQAITDGWMTRNEVRQLEDRDPGPDSLDEYLAPSNMTLISVDGQIVPLSSDGVAAAGTA
jgi:HK97 family phage portal protein